MNREEEILEKVTTYADWADGSTDAVILREDVEKLIPQIYNQAIEDAIEVVNKDLIPDYSAITISKLQSLKK